MADKIVVDGVTYVREDSRPTGNRAVVVVDRGWVFAGDVERDDDRRLSLTRAVWVLRWESIGFDGMVREPKSTKVELRPVPGGVVDLPANSEILSVPVADDWGL